MRKSILYFCVILVGFSCKSEPEVYLSSKGETMGTYYLIKYQYKSSLSKEFEETLNDINQSMSTYIFDSEISKFNRASLSYTIDPSDKYFIEVFEKAKEIHSLSKGDFEPTVYPLLNYWGLGNENRMAPSSIDSSAIDSINRFVDFNLITLKTIDGSQKLNKKDSRVSLDFNALAKGYGVDALAELLESKGIKNYLVEIGGEQRASGVNDKGKVWVIGITEPLENGPINQAIALAGLDNCAMAGSGNYRNFYTKDGVKYGHTINPNSGFPEINTLLGVSVIAKDCMTADAIATTCMVKGLDEAYDFVSELSDVHAYFIYNRDDTLAFKGTEGFKKYLIK